MCRGRFDYRGKDVYDVHLKKEPMGEWGQASWVLRSMTLCEAACLMQGEQLCKVWGCQNLQKYAK